MTGWLAASAVEISDGNGDWSAIKEHAARLQAESGMGTDAIAAETGISPVTLWRWNKDPAFRERVRQINAELDQEAYRTFLARKRNRVVKLAEMANLIEDRIRKNAKSSPMLVREWRGLYEQIARELGQWSDKFEVSGEVNVRKLEIREVVIHLPDDPQEGNNAATDAEWRDVSTNRN